MIRIEEGSCLDVTIQIEGTIDEGEWLEVTCFSHGWECGHRHTRWGPILRCITRHVASMVEVTE